MTFEDAVERALSDAKHEAVVEAGGKITILQMVDVVRATAHATEHQQRDAVRNLADPDPVEMYRVAVLDALGNFLDACHHRPADVARRFNSRRSS